jgi:hypothetical protein
MDDMDSVASAPTDLGEQPFLSFEEITFMTRREVEEGKELDNDELVAPEEEEQQEAGDELVDTQVVTQLSLSGAMRKTSVWWPFPKM